VKKLIFAACLLASTNAFGASWVLVALGDNDFALYNFGYRNGSGISLMVHCGESQVQITTSTEYGLSAYRNGMNENYQPMYAYFFDFGDKGEFFIFDFEVESSPEGIFFKGPTADEFINLLMSANAMTHENYTVPLDGSAKAIRATCDQKFWNPTMG